MRLHLLTAALALLPARLRAAPPEPTPSARLERLAGQYVDGLLRAKPHLASAAGDRRFDGKVQDLSASGLARRITELSRQEAELRRLRAEPLDAAARVDAAILADGIALELLELREIRPWTWNPRLEDPFVHFDGREMVGSRLEGLVHGNAPVAERLASLKAQLSALPRHLRQREEAFEAVSRVHLDQAVQDTAGLVALLEGPVRDFTRADPAAERARAAALRALHGYRRVLQEVLPPRATRDWRLGAALYGKKFPHALQTDLAPEVVAERALASLRATRARLFETARAIHASAWPGEPAPAADAPADLQAKVIARVADEIARVHPGPDELVSATAGKLDGLRAFIEKEGLITLPPPSTLRVLPMPAFKRGGFGAEYLAPGILGGRDGWRGVYHVDPPDPAWPADRTEGYLRTWNETEIGLTAAHEAYPGHHTQAWWSLRDPSRLRSVLWSGTFAEGWAVYATTLLVERGYGGPRARFSDLQGQLIVAANAVLDIRLQRGEWSDAEALRFLEEESFQGKVQAEQKLLRAKLDSTQLCQYFLGTEEIRALEAEVRAQGRFDQRAFDEALVGHGTIAVKHLGPLVLGR